MLFFFEAGFFVLALVALALVEFWGRLQTLALWAVVTLASLVAGPLILHRLGSRQPTDRREAEWRRALVDSWRHFDMLLLLGLVVLAGWWWLQR